MNAAPWAERFAHGLSPCWRLALPGGGRLETGPEGLRLCNPVATGHAYTNAQIDDYQSLPRSRFPWRPPLRLVLRARFSHPGPQAGGPPETWLTGTAGFGFWNDPFLMTGLRAPALPQAVWFFYAGPRSNMALDLHTPGWGWKAATIDARRWPFLALAPAAPLAMPFMRIPWLHRWLWPLGQRAIGVEERLVPGPMDRWRIYAIDWRADTVQFFVDGRLLLRTRHAPAGPLGLVLWIDNQFMQVTPWGRFRWGLVEKTAPQWLEVDWLSVEPGRAMEESSRLGAATR